jgi:fucose permease
VLLMVSVRLPLRAETQASRSDRPSRPRLPPRFWLYASFAIAYGICETMNGNWSQLEMTTRLGATATQASVALAAFWGMVTVGRIVFSAVGRWPPERTTYRVLPFVLVGTFLLIGALSRPHAPAGIAVFAVAGLGCSALLPLTISFGEEDLTTIAAAMAGGVIAFYQFGYGVAAFGVGPLQNAGVSLSATFGFTSIIAAVMAVMAFFVGPSLAAVSQTPAAEAGLDATGAIG